MISVERLQSILDGFSALRVALVGDLFLDRYLEIDPQIQERSLETGLEAYQVVRVRNCPGALGTVLNNLAALGVGQLWPVTAIGRDGHGYDLFNALQRMPLRTEGIVQCDDRLTPTYTKPIRRTAGGSWEELNRLDVRTRAPLTEATTSELCQRLRAAFGACDGLIVLDQVPEADWGVINGRVRQLLAELQHERPDKLILIDSRCRIGQFDCGTLKGNRDELVTGAGLRREDPSAAEQAARRLAQKTNRPVFCTLGQQGILVGYPDGHHAIAPGCRVDGPIDIVGAGDSVTAAIVSSLLAGATELEAAAIGNLVASVTIQQLGTTGTASPADVLRRWHEVSGK